MKKWICSALLSVLLSACSSSGGSSVELNVGITDEEYCSRLREWGAADVFINRKDGVFSYGVLVGEVSGDPDVVARLWYEDAYNSGIRGISECRVVELPKGKIIGRYKPE